MSDLNNLHDVFTSIPKNSQGEVFWISKRGRLLAIFDVMVKCWIKLESGVGNLENVKLEKTLLESDQKCNNNLHRSCGRTKF